MDMQDSAMDALVDKIVDRVADKLVGPVAEAILQKYTAGEPAGDGLGPEGGMGDPSLGDPGMDEGLGDPGLGDGEPPVLDDDAFDEPEADAGPAPMAPPAPVGGEEETEGGEDEESEPEGEDEPEGDPEMADEPKTEKMSRTESPAGDATLIRYRRELETEKAKNAKLERRISALEQKQAEDIVRYRRSNRAFDLETMRREGYELDVADELEFVEKFSDEAFEAHKDRIRTRYRFTPTETGFLPVASGRSSNADEGDEISSEDIIRYASENGVTDPNKAIEGAISLRKKAAK